MSGLLIIQNITREGPGLLEQVLREENVTFDVVDLGHGQELPYVANCKALVVLGGPDSANDTTPKMTIELAFIKKCRDAGIPSLGICLGLQAMVKVASGAVVPGAIKEVGFINPDGNQHTVTVTDAGRTDPLLAGLPEILQRQTMLLTQRCYAKR